MGCGLPSTVSIVRLPNKPGAASQLGGEFGQRPPDSGGPVGELARGQGAGGRAADRASGKVCGGVPAVPAAAGAVR